MDRVAFFRDYLQTKPDDRFARYSLALELKKAGQLDEAEAELRTMLAAHPQSGAGYLQLGEVLETQERLDDAKRAYADGIAALAVPTDAEARKAKAELQQAFDAVEDRILYG